MDRFQNSNAPADPDDDVMLASTMDDDGIVSGKARWRQAKARARHACRV
jgi:hypothetical protein